jgi:uncharacterized protein YjbI with pentapeptide repeats
MSLLDLLTAENVTEFNETRGERAKVDLFAADLAEKKLPMVDLSGADVDKADLTGADLTQAGLYKARMNGIDGTGMKLMDCLGARVKLREAWLEEADLSGSDFANADLSEATVIRSVATGLRLTGGKLKMIDAKHARWTDCDLSSTHLSKADFTDADLSRVDLTEAAGGEVLAVRTRFDAAIGSQARLPGADFTGASFKGAKFDGANLSECDFTDADLSQADFTGANLAGATFAGATLTGAVLAEASLDGVDLAGLDLTDVDFTGLDADLLGLSEAQRDQILAIGIPVNPDARLKPTKVATARHGELIVGVWENDDGEGMKTLRWFARTGKGVSHGILPVIVASVLDRAVVATEKGISIVLHRDRPGGVTLDAFQIGLDGRLTGSTTDPLGYPPMVMPAIVPSGERFRVYGLARRGPTLAINGPTEEGMGIVSSKAMPTAQSFLSREQPFLSCKGNVLMPLVGPGAGKPFRSPAGFPGKHPTVALDDDRWLMVWVQPPAGKDKGGIRAAHLVTRGSPEVFPLTGNGAVLSLAVTTAADQVWLAWVELFGLGETRVHLMAVGEPTPKVLPAEDVDHVAFATGPDGEVALVLTTDDERVVLTDLKGRNLGTLADA